METFEIFGREIEANYDVRNYGIIRKDYLQIASETCEAFSDFWKKNCGDIYDVVEYCPRFFDTVISMLVGGAVNNLIANRIYDMDEDSFYEKYEHKYFDCSFFDTILDKYDSIMKNKDASYASASREREYNSISSSRWSGGGFGLVGAMKGAATASFLNGISDSIASAKAKRNYNKRINEVDSFYEKELNKLYNTVYSLVFDNIWNLCINGMYAYIDELEYNEKLEYPDLNQKKANTIYNNSIKYAKDDDLIINMIDCIKYWPFEEEYFVVLYEQENITDEDAKTIDEMVKFYQLGDTFYEKTEGARKKRIVNNIMKKMDENKTSSLIDKARFIGECFEKEYYGNDILNENDKQKLIKHIKDTAQIVAAEIEKYTGKDQNEKISNYISKNNLLTSDEKILQASFAYAEISEKYPFFETLNVDEYNLVLDESYLEFLSKVKVFYDLVGTTPEKAPRSLKNILERRLLYHWMEEANDEAAIDFFDNVQKAYINTFVGEEKVSAKVMDARRSNLVKKQEGENKLKEKYGRIEKEDVVEAGLLTQLMKDIKELIPSDLTSDVANECKERVVEAITKDIKSLSVIDLYLMQRNILSYNDPVLTAKGQQVKAYFLTIIGEKESEYDDDAFGTYVNETIKLEKKCEKATLKELAEIIDKLKTFPECISGATLIKAQKLNDEKIKEQESEFQELIKDYENKSETELKNILAKCNAYPSELTETVKLDIQNKINDLENEKYKEGLEQLSLISESIDTMLFMELFEAISTVSEELDIPPKRKEETLKKINLRITSKKDEIAIKIHDDIRERYPQYSKIFNYFEFILPSERKSKNESDGITLVRVKDLYSNAGLANGLGSSEGVIFTTHNVIINTEYGVRTVSIKYGTVFTTKGFFSKDIMLGTDRVRYTCPSGIEADEMVTIFNFIIEKIRQSEFHKEVSKKTAVEVPNDVLSEPVSREKLELQVCDWFSEYKANNVTVGFFCKNHSLFAENVRIIEKSLRYVDNDEFILFIFDDSLFGVCKKGFIITNKRVYDLSERTSINIGDILDVNLQKTPYVSFEYAGGRTFSIKAGIAPKEERKKPVHDFLMGIIKIIRGEAQ